MPDDRFQPLLGHGRGSGRSDPPSRNRPRASASTDEPAARVCINRERPGAVDKLNFAEFAAEAVGSLDVAYQVATGMLSSGDTHRRRDPATGLDETFTVLDPAALRSQLDAYLDSLR